MQPSVTLHDIRVAIDDDAVRFVSPRRVVTEMNVWRGDHVLDMSAGAGHFMPHLREAVGSDGRVYARNEHDTHHQLIIRDYVRRGMHEVVPFMHAFADGESAVDAGTVDAVLLANVLSRETARAAPILAEVARITRRGGKVCVVDWNSLADTERALVDLLESYGFMKKRELTKQAVGTYHYGILFTKV